MRGITVSVGYGDLLRLTLPRNVPLFTEVVVVTDTKDEETKAVAAKVPNVRLFVTDAFYAQGARFNKGIALEQGLDFLGRDGWICIHDADTLLQDPKHPHPIDPGLEIGNLYVPVRRILADPRLWTEALDWSTLPRKHEPGEWPGYCQIFHASDSLLVHRRPWYGTDWKHAGGCDSDFQRIWPDSKKVRPPFEVLHLGEDGKNWSGRATVRVDGTMPPNADANAQAQQRMLSARRRRGGRVRYEAEKLR